MSLTRYLYIKEEVEMSLVASLLERKSLDECYFWLDELVESGFDVRQLIWKIFYDFYFEYYPKLEAYILYKDDSRFVVRQFFRLPASPTVFRRRMADEVPPTLEALANGKDVQAYWDGATTYTDDAHRLLAMETQLCVPDEELPVLTLMIRPKFPKRREPTVTRPYRILEEMRRYSVREDIGAFVPQRFNTPPFETWQYDAYETPCWKERFHAFGGVPNPKTRRVEFPNDEALEVFDEKYGYEPDEQSSALQRMSHPKFNEKIEIKILQLAHSHPPW